mmetsp:Transcript_56223/g.65674  ORF Transcript_56223/g.65674 Transcript_56223/m.65674 type:complete len:87 (-) Transcript_56223:90-350(-)
MEGVWKQPKLQTEALFTHQTRITLQLDPDTFIYIIIVILLCLQLKVIPLLCSLRNEFLHVASEMEPPTVTTADFLSELNYAKSSIA